MNKTKTKQARKSEPKNKPTLVAFLLDRSGSMGASRTETISGFNTYIKDLAKSKDLQMRFFMQQFDSQGIDVICDCVPVSEVEPLTLETFVPRAWTPLYDSMGSAIERVSEKAGKKYKVLFVTLTDGAENASSKVSLDGLKAMIKTKESKEHWTFAYIGVGIEGFGAVANIAQGTMSSTNVLRSDHKDTKRSYGKLAAQTRSYCSNTDASSSSVKGFWGGGVS